MPSVSYDSQSLLLGSARGRDQRFSLVAAAFDPSLHDPESWSSDLVRLRRAGFNSVVVRVPWLLHEPTPGRFVFDGACDVRRAITLAGSAGLSVVLRIGPCVGGSFAEGGLPGWIAEVAGYRVREASPAFLDRVTKFWHRLAREFVDLQASRNGNGVPRPVIAVGIEDSWWCADAEVGSAYFASLVRFARDMGVEVPLISANNCWYIHEGVIDAWRLAGEVHAVAGELHQVQPDAPPMVSVVSFSFLPEALRATTDTVNLAGHVAEAVAARADIVLEVLASRHRGATSTLGAAEDDAIELFPMRRALAFASSFGAVLAELKPDEPEGEPGVPRTNPRAMELRGTRNERVTVVIDRSRIEPKRFKRTEATKKVAAKRSSALAHRCADGTAQPIVETSAGGVDFFASDLVLAGARLERCSGSLVALAGDMVVVAGKPRGRMRVKVNGSEVVLSVPADGAAPKVTKVRGLRFVAVPHGLADGIGLVGDGFEFVDARGTVLVSIDARGTVVRGKSASTQASGAPRTPEPVLSPFEMVVESGFVDGSHPRFASVAAPQSLGASGVQALSAYYRARWKNAGRTKRLVALPHARAVAGRLAVDGTRQRDAADPIVELQPGGKTRTLVAEVRNPGSSLRSTLQVGVFGALVEVAPLKGVSCSKSEVPAFDPAVGRFVQGYDTRGGAPTLRWSFAARTGAVVLRVARGLDAQFLRLNGKLLSEIGGFPDEDELHFIDGALLSPMQPKALAKGEKPPKAKNAKLVATANELLLDIERPLAARELEAWRKGVRLYEVRGEIAAEWAFARVEPPASWALSKPLPKSVSKSGTGAPTWFRGTFSNAEPCALEMIVTHPIGRVATILVNGESVLVLDGASGREVGTGKSRKLVRTARVPAALVRAGLNEVCVFEPDGMLPEIAFRA